MHCHANARLTPRGRAELFRSVEAGMTVTAACVGFRVSRRTFYRWLPRWRAQGEAGLVDRSSRPHHSPQQVAPETEREVAQVRAATGWGADRIGALLGMAPSTCHRVLDRLGYLERTAPPEAVVRYEIAEPGGLVHLDTKKLGRIGDSTGHRATGDRRSRSGASAGRSSTSRSTLRRASSTPSSCPTRRAASSSARSAGSGTEGSTSSGC